jgi:hypothetical protein
LQADDTEAVATVVVAAVGAVTGLQGVNAVLKLGDDVLSYLVRTGCIYYMGLQLNQYEINFDLYFLMFRWYRVHDLW